MHTHTHTPAHDTDCTSLFPPWPGGLVPDHCLVPWFPLPTVAWIHCAPVLRPRNLLFAWRHGSLICWIYGVTDSLTDGSIAPLSGTVAQDRSSMLPRCDDWMVQCLGHVDNPPLHIPDLVFKASQGRSIAQTYVQRQSIGIVYTAIDLYDVR